MIASVLNIIKNELQKIGVPYEFMRWTSTPVYPYFIGEYTESGTLTEDGAKEYILLLTGTTKESWLTLEEHRVRIEDHFPAVGGFRTSTDDGAVVIFYDNSMPVDTGDADLKRIQINLSIKAWKGMN